jgi:hypothetical protein
MKMKSNVILLDRRYNNKLEKSNFKFYKTFEELTIDLATKLLDNTILIKDREEWR